jgi:phosphorylcholine metabolism protein LicD
LKSSHERSDPTKAHNIIYWVDCGTCLGAFRYGGIIPWDWDIGISILLADHDNVKQIPLHARSRKVPNSRLVQLQPAKTFLKLFVKETKNFIDIYHYQINETDKTVGYLFSYLDSPFPASWKKRRTQMHQAP